MKKTADNIRIIGKSDGPTSVFIAGKGEKKSLRQKIEKTMYDFRRKRVIKFLRADPHTVDEVADYLVRELGYTEVSPSDETYQTEYSNLRVAFLLQYCPELLGDLTEPQRPQQWDEKSAMEFMKQVEQRTEAARAVPKIEFDIDFHLYRKTGRDFEMSISIEKIYESFSGSASGSTRVMRRYGADFRKVYRYYGVSQEDIRQHTKRFEEVVRQLTVR